METEGGEDGTGVGTSSGACTVTDVLSVSDRGFLSAVGLLWEMTLKNDEDSLLGVTVRVVAPEGRPGRSLSFSTGPPFSFSFSRSLPLILNDSFEGRFVTRREIVLAFSSEPDEPCFLCRVCCSAGNEERSIDGMWMQSNPVRVSRYRTCILSNT